VARRPTSSLPCDAPRHGDFQVGVLVLGASGWQDDAVSDGVGLTPLFPREPHPSRALGVLGMPGLTAYMGLLDIGRPVAGETVVVAAASGAVGSVVGQIAKILGCHVVGIAGGEDKCRHVMDELGFDYCVDHHADDLPGQAGPADGHAAAQAHHAAGFHRDGGLRDKQELAHE
jgi:hypothetical protein